MPWLEKCLVGLPNKMVHGEKLETLTFLSCIGIIENGDYVDYVAPRELTLDLPLRQSKMQELHLQSHHSLPKVGPLVVWRLHEDIPCRVPKLETHLTSKEPQNKKNPPGRARGHPGCGWGGQTSWHTEADTGVYPHKLPSTLVSHWALLCWPDQNCLTQKGRYCIFKTMWAKPGPCQTF